MPIAEKAAALLEAITPADLETMVPAARHRFAALCRWAAELAEPRPEPPKSGVLACLRDGARFE